MTQYERISIFLLRISLGWLLFYAGITKVLYDGPVSGAPKNAPDHWSSPNGCHEDCPACTEEREELTNK